MKMKKLLIEYGHLKLEDLPQAVRAQVETNEEALAYFRRSQQVNDLLHIKRYEIPPPETAGRHVYNVRTRIEATGGMDLDESPSFLPGRWITSGAFGAVAVAAIVMVGMSLQPAQNTAPGIADVVPAQPEPSSPTIANLPPLPSAPVESFETMELVSSNNFPVNVGGPGGPQFIGQ